MTDVLLNGRDIAQPLHRAPLERSCHENSSVRVLHGVPWCMSSAVTTGAEADVARGLESYVHRTAEPECSLGRRARVQQ